MRHTVLLALLVLLVLFIPPAQSRSSERVDAVLILDISESMSKIPENWNETKAYVQLVQMRRFVYELPQDGSWMVAVVEFSTVARVMAGLRPLSTSGDAAAIVSSMSGSSRGRTNIAHALSLARNILLNSTRDSDASVIILITDGKPTDPGPDPLKTTPDMASATKAAGIVLVTTLLPFSQLSSTDIVFMRRLASRPDLFRYTPSPEELRAWLEELSGLTYAKYAHVLNPVESFISSFTSRLLVPIEFKTTLQRVVLAVLLALGLILLYVELRKR